jgi:hypothetical protein
MLQKVPFVRWGHYIAGGQPALADKTPPVVQKARANVIPSRDVADARPRLLTLGHDPKFLGDALPAAALTPGDDLNGPVCHRP